MKIVINVCFGGFSLSEEACKELGLTYGGRDVERNDPALIEVVERLGRRANGSFADLKIVEIPDGVEWEIDEYDGSERVAEKHRTWS